jgi:hypothetical protein
LCQETQTLSDLHLPTAADELQLFLEALGAIPSPLSLDLPLDFKYVDPAEILLTKWTPYTIAKMVKAKLEDFPDKLEVGVTDQKILSNCYITNTIVYFCVYVFSSSKVLLQ